MFTAYYDLEWSPPTYDIVGPLSLFALEQKRRGEKKINVVFVPGSAGGFRKDTLWPYDLAERRRMLDRVAVPMARMLPGATVEVLEKRPAGPVPNSFGLGVALHGLATQIQALAAGSRPLRPSYEDHPARRLVTITLREAEHWPERNSNLDHWLRAAIDIANMDYDIRFVRDTTRAGAAFGPFAINVEAAVDLEARARLYRSAVCNLFVSNGPAWFSLALDAPTLMMKPLTDNGKRAYSADYFRECGLPKGSQIPGSPAYQRIVWEEDRTSAIVAAFKEFVDATCGVS